MVSKYKNNSINKISSCKFTSSGEHYFAKSTFSTIMQNTRRHSYDLIFKLEIVAEAEAVNNNRVIAREYGIFESIDRKWHNQQDILFSGNWRWQPSALPWAVTDQKIPNLINCAWSKSASGYYLFWLSHAHVLVNLLFIAFTDWCRFCFVSRSFSERHEEGTQHRSGVQSITWMVQRLETPPFHFHTNQDHSSLASTS